MEVSMCKIEQIFSDQKLIVKIQSRLPYLFQLAELESMRGGKIGMEVGSVREKIIVALLIYQFGESNVKTEFPITEPEVDVEVKGEKYSIKTITQKKLGGGVKLIWTVDAEKAEEFREHYYPICGMFFVHINWSNGGGLYFFSQEIQEEVLSKLGRESYLKLPKKGTNPRGVEMTSEALKLLSDHPNKFFIPINWKKTKIEYDPFKRWVDYWSE